MAIEHIPNMVGEGRGGKLLKTGAPGEIRTPDHLVRSQVLYPAELRALFNDWNFGGPSAIRTQDQRVKSPVLYRLS